MSQVFFAGIAAVAAAVLGALITVVNQNRQIKIQAETLRLEQVASSKKAVIEDLVAYRFVLTENGNHAIPTMRFNVALSKIPVLFGLNKTCIQLYSDLGDDFTASKFNDLIIQLMRDVPLETTHMSASLLEKVPNRRPMTGT